MAFKNTIENLATFKKQAATKDYVNNIIETRVVTTDTDQSIQSDKRFEGVVTHDDNVVFNETVFIRDGFVGPENNKVEVSDISLANNLENGQGNGALIQTNKVLETGNE